MIRLQRCVDAKTGQRSSEAFDITLGHWWLEVRWRSAEDGITPFWGVCGGHTTSRGLREISFNWVIRRAKD